MDIKILQKTSPSVEGTFIERNPNISYLVTAGKETKQSLLIDASGIDINMLDNFLKLEKSVLIGIILTHFHGDHFTDMDKVIRKYPDINIYLNNISANQLISQGYNNVIPLSRNQTLPLADTELIVLYTPGHTNDSISILHSADKLLFTGDCLFGGGIGCCDYAHGGNRNIFFHTLEGILMRVPDQTSIYPGHYSEHYRKSPPYSIEGEKNDNPYLNAVANGRRGDFDRSLKQFSIEFEADDHIILNETDIDRICDLEKTTWIPELQATRETILSRLKAGHKMLSVVDNNELAGMVCWRYSDYSIGESAEKFPHDFSVFSLQQSTEISKAKSAFIYNLGVRSSSRKSGTGSALLQWAFETIRNEGITQVFVDSRIPSYHGSLYSTIENVSAAPAFKEAINQYLEQNVRPTRQRLFMDPTLRFYMANGFKPWLIIDNFIQDRSSGNIRVICYINLEQDSMVELSMHPL